MIKSILTVSSSVNGVRIDGFCVSSMFVTVISTIVSLPGDTSKISVVLLGVKALVAGTSASSIPS